MLLCVMCKRFTVACVLCVFVDYKLFFFSVPSVELLFLFFINSNKFELVFFREFEAF